MANEIDFDLRIDENSLDEEWVNQPRLYFRYAEKLALAKRRLEEIKNELEVTRADLDQSIRSNPDGFGIEKVTEAAISAAIQDSTEYKKVQKEIIDAKHKADIYAAAVQALDHRRAALEGLVKLFLANYFSKPRADAGDEEDIDRMEKRVTRRGGRKRE